MRHKKTNKIEYELKMRGIKQDVLVDYELPFQVFKHKVKHFGSLRPTYVFQQLFRPKLAGGIAKTDTGFLLAKKGAIVETMEFEKEMDVICPKGLVDDLDDIFMEVYPIGY